MTKRHHLGKTGSSYPHGGGRLLGYTRRPRQWAVRLLPDGIRERLFLLIVLAAVPVLILQGWIYYQRHDARRDQALQMEFEVAQGVGMTFSAYLDGLHRQLDAVGQTTLAFTTYTDANLEHLLKAAAAGHPSIRSMSWVGPEGRILASSLPEAVGRDVSTWPFFQQIRAGRSWVVGDLIPQGPVMERPTVAVATAIRDDDGKLLGVVVANLEPMRLGELTFPRERYAGGMYTIFDSQGRLVYRNPLVPLAWEERMQWRQDDSLLERALQGQDAEGIIRSPITGFRVLAARVPIPGTGWVAGAARPMATATPPLRRALLQDALLGILVASVAFLLAALVARTIAGPLRHLEHDAQAMGAGTIAPSESLRAPTEVRRLRDTVSTMAADLINRADALRESEHRYRTLFTNMNEGFALGEAMFREDGAARDFRFLEINEAFERQTGLTREILGRPMTEVLPHLEQYWIDTYGNVARTGQPASFTNYNRDTGRHYDVFCYSPASNRFAILFRDVTQRVQAEQTLHEMNGRLQQQTEELQAQAEELRVANEALERREREYRTLAENTPELIARFDRRLRHTYINEYGAKVYGVSQRAVIGKTNAELGMPADKVAFWEEHFEQVFAAGRQQTVDFEFDSPTFGHQYFSSLFVPEFDVHGQVASILAITRDVTVVKRAEEALRESEQWFRTLASAMPQLVWTADPDGRVDYYNERYKEYRGIERTTDGSFYWAPVLHPEDVAPTIAVWQHAVQTGETYQIEHRVQRADGSYHWHLSRGTPVRDSQGRIVKWFGTATDIDDLKRAERQLRDLTATLESKVAQRTAELEHRARQLQKLTLELSQTEDRERRHLADILHDDLQQQLAAVKFHVGMMNGRIRGDAALERIVFQLDKMLTDAIETSRSLSHELSPAMLYRGSLGETVEWLANQIRTKHGLNVRARTDGEVSLRSDALKAFLYKAVQELLFNVVKHARVGEAGVRVRRSGPCVCVVVSDRGRGFDPKDLRAAAGFGLFSIRERVQLLGGRMKIRSARGKGSTFFIAVPDGEASEDTVGVGPRAYPLPDGDKAKEGDHGGPPLRVLVADDHEVVRQGLAALLREEPDIEVVGEAANGREAVDMASRLRPDVVIMDVAMPLMNGDEATRQTKLHLPGTRVIALSMYAEDAMIEKMQHAGADCYVLKTAPAGELLATIRGKSKQVSA